MTPPLVLDAKSELLLFKSVTDLSAYVEAIDVRRGEYPRCWDSSGRLLRLSIAASTFRLLRLPIWSRERILVEDAEQEASHLHELHHELIRSLVALGLEANVAETIDTDELLALAVEYLGWA